MSEYEVTFKTCALNEVQEQQVLADLDGFVGGHGEQTLVTVSADGDTAVAVTKRLIANLRGLGIEVLEVHPDLVPLGVIAQRTGTTRQAVSNWSRRARRAANPFPRPTFLAGGGLWRWQEVNEWLAQRQLAHDPVSYLTAQDELIVNYWLRVHTNAFASSRSGWGTPRRVEATGVAQGPVASPTGWTVHDKLDVFVQRREGADA